jgi:hypothetical protein
MRLGLLSARFAFLGVLTRWFGVDVASRPVLIEMISFWAVIASECALFWGASFQYEACSASVSLDLEESSAETGSTEF